jgi:hypothetical protein
MYPVVKCGVLDANHVQNHATGCAVVDSSIGEVDWLVSPTKRSIVLQKSSQKNGGRHDGVPELHRAEHHRVPGSGAAVVSACVWTG